MENSKDNNIYPLNVNKENNRKRKQIYKNQKHHSINKKPVSNDDIKIHNKNNILEVHMKIPYPAQIAHNNIKININKSKEKQIIINENKENNIYNRNNCNKNMHKQNLYNTYNKNNNRIISPESTNLIRENPNYSNINNNENRIEKIDKINNENNNNS